MVSQLQYGQDLQVGALGERPLLNMGESNVYVPVLGPDASVPSSQSLFRVY